MAPSSDSDLLWPPGTVRLEGNYTRLELRKLRSTKHSPAQHGGNGLMIQQSFNSQVQSMQ